MLVDVGTGTGSWAIEVAELYRKCRVVGTDLSPIQPEDIPEDIPENVDFFLEDLVHGLNLDDDSTDLVNSR
jgi:ubiquinone/menaquinone biosynthesis C-methylase UbiE